MRKIRFKDNQVPDSMRDNMSKKKKKKGKKGNTPFHKALRK